MSTETRAADAALDLKGLDSVRAVALGGIGLLIAAYGSVFYHFIDVTGEPLVFLVLGAATLGAGTLLARSLRLRWAAVVAVGLLATGLGLYIVSLPRQPPLVPLLTDAVALMTGRSLLQVTNVDLWVLGVAPGPLFLTWYLAVRRRYVGGVLAGGATLGFLVLTGDASNVTTLLGVVGGIVAVAVGDMDRRGDSLRAAEPLAVLLAALILLSAIAPVVPAGPSRTADTWSSFQTGGPGGSVEANLVEADSQLGIAGNLSLSPAVRFRVESDAESYWQVGSYDRYTGDGWIRTGSSYSYNGRIRGPPGQSRAVSQTVTAIDEISVLPAAWKPVEVSGSVSDRARVTDLDGLELDGSLASGERYSVTSRVPVASARDLRSAGTDYPSAVAERFTRLPSSTPDRVAERTERITARADNPYATARVVERWLENNKNYSLDVERPRGNTADEFLFEMDAGYCTYFATTMATMLRTQDIPARMAVGYTSGERVAEDEWVVRGYDAHAWVEVYFPEVGWVRFDPTPAGPRQAAEQGELTEARESNRTDVDTNETGSGDWTPTPTATPAPLTPRAEQPVQEAPGQVTVPDRITRPGGGPTGDVDTSNITVTRPPTNAPGGGDADEGDDGAAGPLDGRPPTRAEATLATIVLVGAVVALRRTGVTGRIYRAVWLRYQPTKDPETDAERAFDRLEYVLAERHRPRRPEETPRQYLASIGADERAAQVAAVRERAKYAGRVTREEADEAVDLVDDMVGWRGA
ncbi:transglutaminase domain protein [Halosimplex carlsbadense 2-9-1]|uniref:Transglutaminase domain protein n=1 Tax=Halosimplex carlsbadense 2-9-1 TaxID=797114 RepID=M0D640_9EURY|nr:transglutaminaseTgpA domain-containing protein [Halosimplex carlsbadense]ELZ29609.1 transglutaminase domain protein [Halosimplex carlsbadense 2-9-1]